MLLKEFITFILENEANSEKTNPGKGPGGRAVLQATSNVSTRSKISKLAKNTAEFIQEHLYWTNPDLHSGKLQSGVLELTLKVINMIEDDDDLKHKLQQAYKEVKTLYDKGIEDIGSTSTQTDVTEAYHDFVWFENEEEYKKIKNLYVILQNIR